MSDCRAALPRAGEIDLGRHRNRRQHDRHDERSESNSTHGFTPSENSYHLDEQGVGSHLAPFGSFLNIGAASFAFRRYCGSSICCGDRQPLLAVRPLVEIPVFGQHDVLAVRDAVLAQVPGAQSSS